MLMPDRPSIAVIPAIVSRHSLYRVFSSSYVSHSRMNYPTVRVSRGWQERTSPVLFRNALSCGAFTVFSLKPCQPHQKTHERDNQTGPVSIQKDDRSFQNVPPS